MAEYTLNYGHDTVSFTLDQNRQIEWLIPAETPAAADQKGCIQNALENPIDGFRLNNFSNLRSVAIAINDKTRPVPHDLLLPPLLAQLERIGLPTNAVTLVIATGTHIPMTRDTYHQIVSSAISQRYRIISHDCDSPDLISIGTTSCGTPVQVNRCFAEADLRIVVGNIEPHHFAGFSGGVKSAAIGLASRDTITANHALLRDPQSALAVFDDNPLRQDIEEIGKLMDIHFALNIVMNRKKQVVQAFAGKPENVVKAGLPVVNNIYNVEVEKPFDVMITSPGGYPKDINLYQAHKAVSCANRVTRKGGSIILVAACEDGVGSTGYAAWMDEKVSKGINSHEKVMESFIKEPFQIGPHKAFIFARDAVRVNGIWVVSDIEPNHIRKLLLNPASLQQAINEVIDPLPPDARIGLMPYANATIPYLRVGSEGS